MTFLAITTSPDRITLSTDTAGVNMAGREPFPAWPTGGDYWTGHDQFWRDDRLGPEPVEPDLHVAKIARIGGTYLAIVGDWSCLHAWQNELVKHGADTFDAALAMSGQVRDALRDCQSSHLIVAGIGRDGPMAFQFSAPHYAPARLAIGHTFHPVPCADVDGHDEILEQWEPAVAGQGVAAFHGLVYTNVLTGWR